MDKAPDGKIKTILSTTFEADLNSELGKLLHLLLKTDPLSQLTVTAGSDHCFHICRPAVLTFKTKVKTMFATGETVGQAVWIIDDTCLVHIIAQVFGYCPF